MPVIDLSSKPEYHPPAYRAQCDKRQMVTLAISDALPEIVSSTMNTIDAGRSKEPLKPSEVFVNPAGYIHPQAANAPEIQILANVSSGEVNTSEDAIIRRALVRQGLKNGLVDLYEASGEDQCWWPQFADIEVVLVDMCGYTLSFTPRVIEIIGSWGAPPV